MNEAKERTALNLESVEEGFVRVVGESASLVSEGTAREERTYSVSTDDMRAFVPIVRSIVIL